jgi:hypothetical protein
LEPRRDALRGLPRVLDRHTGAGWGALGRLLKAAQPSAKGKLGGGPRTSPLPRRGEVPSGAALAGQGWGGWWSGIEVEESRREGE